MASADVIPTNKPMIEKIIYDKAKYLDQHYPFLPIPALTEKFLCIHCYKALKMGDFKVFVGANGFEYICCPNAPACDGTVIDWVPQKRQATRIHAQARHRFRSANIILPN